MGFLRLMKTLDAHHTAAFSGVKLPAHHGCIYITYENVTLSPQQ